MNSVCGVLSDYLEGRSNRWGEIAHSQVESVFEWISDGAWIRPEHLRGSGLAEDIYSLFFSPVAVSHYASLGSKEAIERALTLRVRAAVKNFEARSNLVAEESAELDPEVDLEEEAILGGRYRPVIHEPVLEDSDFDPAGRSTFRPYEWLSEDWSAYIDVSGVVDEVPGERLLEESCKTGLKLIDSGLYAAILKDPHLMRSIGWRDFERLLAQILEEFGYSVELQRGSKDGGVDIFALKKEGVFGEEKYLVQAKRWKASVGVAPVRELAFLHSELGMTKSCLATTASFTRGAWELADLHKWQLSLKDFDGLKEWVKDAQEIRRVGPLIKSSGGIYSPKK